MHLNEYYPNKISKFHENQRKLFWYFHQCTSYFNALLKYLHHFSSTFFYLQYPFYCNKQLSISLSGDEAVILTVNLFAAGLHASLFFKDAAQQMGSCIKAFNEVASVHCSMIPLTLAFDARTLN